MMRHTPETATAASTDRASDRSSRSCVRPRDASLPCDQTQGQLRHARLAHGVDQLRQLGKLAGATHDVHMRGAAQDQLLIFLGHAAEDAEDRVGMAALVMAKPAEGGVDFVLGVLADAAGVEEDHVGVGGFVRQLVALAAQGADHQFAVEHVHLAADRFDIEFFLHGCATVLSFLVPSTKHCGGRPILLRARDSVGRACAFLRSGVCLPRFGIDQRATGHRPRKSTRNPSDL